MQIVKYSGLSWSAVNAAILRYKAEGDTALMPAARGRKQGTGRTLTEAQETKVRQLICRKRPWQCKIKNSLWDCDGVMQVIEKEYGIKLSERGLGNYLKRWGFIPKNPNKRGYERCSKPIKELLDENYPKIEQEAQEKNGQIYWINKTAIKYTDTLASGEKQQRLSMVSIVTNQGKIRWLIIKGRFDSSKQISFLKALTKGSRKHIFLIREYPKFEFSTETLRWIQEKMDKIKVLPEQLSSQSDIVRLSTRHSPRHSSGVFEDIEPWDEYPDIHPDDFPEEDLEISEFENLTTLKNA